MTPAETLEIERACARLILQFAKYNDDLDHQSLADLFAEDCTFARPLDPAHPYYGKDKVHAIFRDRKPRLTRHVMTNILIDVISPTEARGNSYVTMVSAPDPEAKWPRPGEGIFFGSFDDSFVRTADGWKFKSRTGNVALHQGGHVPELPVPTLEETGAPK
jgi:hypothetical protein